MVESTAKSDAAIQQDVLRELQWDTRVEETDVGVEVDNGIVTLTRWSDRRNARPRASRWRSTMGP